MHRIRLRGPWEFEWLLESAGDTPVPASGTLRLPETWSDAFGSSYGRVRIRRNFNRPTGLDDGETVWLEVTVSRRSQVMVNGMTLGEVEPGTVRFEVTAHLADYDRVELEIERRDESGDDLSIVEVALVIESPE